MWKLLSIRRSLFQGELSSAQEHTNCVSNTQVARCSVHSLSPLDRCLTLIVISPTPFKVQFCTLRGKFRRVLQTAIETTSNKFDSSSVHPTVIMAKDKKKAGAKAAVKAAKSAKQEKKAGKKDKKVATKVQEVDSDAEEVDLDDVLAQYAKEQEQYHAITEVPTEPPAARSSGTIIASPANENELFLFGGEYFNGATAKFFNDLLVYNIKQDTWKKVTSPNSPLPRSGHAWCRGANTKDIYLFGGEFSSPKQGTFYHYNDFWKLDPMNREWTRVEGKSKAPGPPARSGHRMVGYKQYIILFGGFQDTSATTKYMSDLWIYDCVNFTWHTPKLQAARAVPDARSSFTLLPHEQGAVIYGGYSRVKTVAGGKQQQQQGKGKKGGGGGPANRMVLKPKVHDDTWFLRITSPVADAAPGTLPTVSWEKRKKPANAPNPARAGATMAYHKGRGVLFGGVHDVEDSEEAIDSEFFNQMFVWNIERNRYMPLGLRRPKTNVNKKTAQQANISRRGRAKADEEALLANLKALEERAGAATADSDDEVPKTVEPEEDEIERPEKPRTYEYPHPRFNAALTVQGDHLYIYGGTYEKGDREFTFDELWSINLNHLDGVVEIFKRELADWQGSDDEVDSEDDEEDSDSGFEDEEDEDAASTAPTSTTDSPALPPAKDDDLGPQEEISALTDMLPHPRPFESLRDFYTRTGEAWQNIIIDELEFKGKTGEKSPKEIKKLAFERAEEKWWDCREEIRALEDEQEAAGIGEVVSLAEKEGGGVGRRR
jgi:N-acetylneuraminic acid mutarotase